MRSLHYYEQDPQTTLAVHLRARNVDTRCATDSEYQAMWYSLPTQPQTSGRWRRTKT